MAMFDEVNEENQIFKTAEDSTQLPAGKWFLALDEDGVACSSDFYLRLTADGGRMLKGLMPYQASHPTPHYQRLKIGQTVSFKSMGNNLYVGVESGSAGSLLANKATAGSGEKFKIIDAVNGAIALLALRNNKYVSADNSGTTTLAAKSESIGVTEKFTETDDGNGSVSLKTVSTTMYVNVDNTGNNPLIAKLSISGLWRTFLVEYY